MSSRHSTQKRYIRLRLKMILHSSVHRAMEQLVYRSARNFRRPRLAGPQVKEVACSYQASALSRLNAGSRDKGKATLGSPMPHPRSRNAASWLLSIKYCNLRSW